MAKRPQRTQDEKQARDAARRNELTQRLIDGVKAIQTSDDFKRWLTWSAAFYQYSANNVLLIWSQRPDSTLVGGFHTWRKLGRSVNKGAKGIMIIAPRFKKAATEGEPDSVYFGIEHVFDLSDTSGDPIPSLETPDLEGEGNAAAYAQLMAFATAEGLTITTTPHIETEAHGYYSAKRKLIYIAPTNPAQALRVFVHELAHHLDRENRASKEEKETIAEGAAHVICAHLGLDTSASTYPYIAGWSAIDGGEKTILKCLDRIQRIAKTLIDATKPAQRADESREKNDIAA